MDHTNRTIFSYKVEGDSSEFEGEKEYFFRIYFYFTHGPITSMISILDPEVVHVVEWKQFIKCLKEEKESTLPYWQGNGEGYFSITKDEIEFTSSPSGPGGDFGVTTVIKLK
jgi:hypothetical protein